MAKEVIEYGITSSQYTEDNGLFEIRINGQIGFYFFKATTSFITMGGSPNYYITYNQGMAFFDAIRSTSSDLGMTTNFHTLATEKVSPQSCPEYKIEYNSARESPEGLFDSSVKLLKNQQELMCPVAQQILMFGASNYTRSFTAWRNLYNLDGLELLAHLDLYDLRVTDNIKKQHTVWAVERTAARKMAMEYAKKSGIQRRVKGVRWRPERKRPWVAELRLQKTKKWIGDFDTFEEAVEAHAVAASQHRKSRLLQLPSQEQATNPNGRSSGGDAVHNTKAIGLDHEGAKLSSSCSSAELSKEFSPLDRLVDGLGDILPPFPSPANNDSSTLVDISHCYQPSPVNWTDIESPFSTREGTLSSGSDSELPKGCSPLEQLLDGLGDLRPPFPSPAITESDTLVEINHCRQPSPVKWTDMESPFLTMERTSKAKPSSSCSSSELPKGSSPFEQFLDGSGDLPSPFSSRAINDSSILVAISHCHQPSQLEWIDMESPISTIEGASNAKPSSSCSNSELSKDFIPLEQLLDDLGYMSEESMGCLAFVNNDSHVRNFECHQPLQTSVSAMESHASNILKGNSTHDDSYIRSSTTPLHPVSSELVDAFQGSEEHIQQVFQSVNNSSMSTTLDVDEDSTNVYESIETPRFRRELVHMSSLEANEGLRFSYSENLTSDNIHIFEELDNIMQCWDK